MQVHGYPYDATGSTFIVEMHDDGLARRPGSAELAAAGPAAGRIRRGLDRADRRAVRRRARRPPAAGQQLEWISFGTLRCENWRHGNVVLLGDAAHTAHFSIGSGTKLAMEDALALAACLHEQPGLDAALAAYEAERGRSWRPPSAPRRPAWSGSRTSASTPARSPSSSRSTS